MSDQISRITAETLRSISTPDIVESRLGTLEFKDGKASNWLQTVPGKGYFAILRLYSPEAAFFDKSWRPSEIEPV